MAIEIDMLERMVIEVQEIVDIAESLHLANVSLANVSKAIEQERGCQIFVKALAESYDVGDYQGFTANCEPFLLVAPKKPEDWEQVFVQHFIYYKSDKNPEIEHYRIAHEIGHLALHWPMEENVKPRKKHCTLPGIGRFFLVLYTQEEEEEADAFAILLGAHIPKPKKLAQIRVTSLVRKKINDYTKDGILISHALTK